MADFELDFESTLAAQQQQQTADVNDVPPSEAASMKDKPRNYRQVCWDENRALRGAEGGMWLRSAALSLYFFFFASNM